MLMEVFEGVFVGLGDNFGSGELIVRVSELLVYEHEGDLGGFERTHGGVEELMFGHGVGGVVEDHSGKHGRGEEAQLDDFRKVGSGPGGGVDGGGEVIDCCDDVFLVNGGLGAFAEGKFGLDDALLEADSMGELGEDAGLGKDGVDRVGCRDA